MTISESRASRRETGRGGRAWQAIRRGFLRKVSELRAGQALSRFPQGRGPLLPSAARRSITTVPTMRRLISSFSSSAISWCRLALVVEIAFAPPYWLHAVIWLPLTIALAIGSWRPSRARSSAGNGQTTCTASIRPSENEAGSATTDDARHSANARSDRAPRRIPRHRRQRHKTCPA